MLMYVPKLPFQCDTCCQCHRTATQILCSCKHSLQDGSRLLSKARLIMSPISATSAPLSKVSQQLQMRLLGLLMRMGVTVQHAWWCDPCTLWELDACLSGQCVTFVSMARPSPRLVVDENVSATDGIAMPASLVSE